MTFLLVSSLTLNRLQMYNIIMSAAFVIDLILEILDQAVGRHSNLFSRESFILTLLHWTNFYFTAILGHFLIGCVRKFSSKVNL